VKFEKLNLEAEKLRERKVIRKGPVFGIVYLLVFVVFASVTMNVSAIGAEFPITTNWATQQYPDIYGDRIVWRDNRNYETMKTATGIYICTI
jgi:beta propeller repeat protein